MSLYSLAAGLFEDLDKARALDHLHHHHPTNEGSDEKHQSGSTTIPRTRRCRGEEDGKRRTMNSGRREADEEQIPTLELLEDCLDNIHKVSNRKMTLTCGLVGGSACRCIVVEVAQT